MRIKTHTSISRVILSVFIFCILTAGFPGEQAQTTEKLKILNQQYRIKKQLHPTTEPKITQAVQSFKENFLSSGEESNSIFTAKQVARDQFRTSSASQINLLGFYILTHTYHFHFSANCFIRPPQARPAAPNTYATDAS